MNKPIFDIAPFALPNCDAGQVRFEEPRDIVRVAVTFLNNAPRRIGLSYMKKTWPQNRLDTASDLKNPFVFGWTHVDDWFNCEWQKAAISVKRETRSRVVITFRGLTAEFPGMRDYDVAFREIKPASFPFC